ncbi:MAG: hypothetical protein IJZ85_14010 [Lachnospiraceae bacterium]|nr:hypothetical protein [Lachnospiraceae bacterium]
MKVSFKEVFTKPVPNSMHSLAKTLDKFLKYIFYIVIAASLFVVSFAVISLVSGEMAVQTSLNLGLLNLTVAEGFVPDSGILTICMFLNYAYYLLLAAPLCIGIFIIRSRILYPIQKGRPFSTGLSREWKKLGHLVLIFGGLSSFSKYILETISISSFNVEDLLLSEKVSEITYNVTLDLSFAMVAIVLYFLSYIFHYGEELQRQADEQHSGEPS